MKATQAVGAGQAGGLDRSFPAGRVPGSEGLSRTCCLLGVSLRQSLWIWAFFHICEPSQSRWWIEAVPPCAGLSSGVRITAGTPAVAVLWLGSTESKVIFFCGHGLKTT